MGKTSGQHFPHGCIIIRSGHCPEFKLAIIAAAWFSSLIYNHRTHRFKAVCIGDIISLQSVDLISRKTDEICQFLDRPDGSPFLALDAFSVLLQHHAGIFFGKLHQFFLHALFRNPQIHALSLFVGQPLLDDLPILHIRLQHQFSGNIRSARIKLFDK